MTTQKTLSERELVELERLEQAATAAPWTVADPAALITHRSMFPDYKVEDDATIIERVPQSRAEAMETFFHAVFIGGVQPEDAALVCAARNALPTMLAMLRDAERVIHDLQQESSAFGRGKRAGQWDVLMRFNDACDELNRKWLAEPDSEIAGYDAIAFNHLSITTAGIMKVVAGEAMPSPPDSVREENSRLRVALREIAGGNVPVNVAEIAAKALGEST